VGQDIRTVAVCTASPALTAILSAVIASTPGLRVRDFESRAGLVTYMRLASVALVVCEIDEAAMIEDLRSDPRVADPTFESIALSRTLTRREREIAVLAGIDEVILKPMSPAYLQERVAFRLRRQAERAATVSRGGPRIDRRKPQSSPLAGYRRIGDNVVQLFPHSWQPNP
jgi:two-component system phosphate regulon response regulator PhoB